ncbi:fatty acid binding protein [Brevipalpus obovatus]|uniref:fatty acid binding protein n=1 Tax=Brevipalpus obovatus TaxID=246614 RepID=UPI003D9E66FB
MSDSDIFVGEFSLVSSDKFDEFLAALGVSYLVRKVAITTKPSFVVKKESDEEYIFKTESTFKSTEFKFKLGEPFDEKRMDGVTCKSTITKDGNKLIQKQEGDPPAEYIREFSQEDLKTTCITKGKDGQEVVSVRMYKRKK